MTLGQDLYGLLRAAGFYFVTVLVFFSPAIVVAAAVALFYLLAKLL